MQFLYPAGINATTLLSSSIVEDEYDQWDAGATYSTGQAVIFEHYIFQSLSDANQGNVPDESPLAWTIVMPTNQWAMFDLTRGTSSTAPNLIAVEFRLDGIDAISMLDVVGSSILIRVFNVDDDLVYERTTTLNGDPAALYLADLPGLTGAKVTISVTNDADVSISSLTLGTMFDLGETLLGVGLGITDFSVKQVDDFGNVTLTRRGFTRRMTAKVRVLDELVDTCVRLLAGVRATPVVWIGTSRFASTFIIGYFKDWSVAVSYPTVSDCSLSIEGFAETDSFEFSGVLPGGGGGGAVGNVGLGGGATGTSGGPIDDSGGDDGTYFIAPSFADPTSSFTLSLFTDGPVSVGSTLVFAATSTYQSYAAEFPEQPLLPEGLTLSWTVSRDSVGTGTGLVFNGLLFATGVTLLVAYQSHSFESSYIGKLRVAVNGVDYVLVDATSYFNNTTPHEIEVALDGPFLRLSVDGTQLAGPIGVPTFASAALLGMAIRGDGATTAFGGVSMPKTVHAASLLAT